MSQDSLSWEGARQQSTAPPSWGRGCDVSGASRPQSPLAGGVGLPQLDHPGVGVHPPCLAPALKLIARRDLLLGVGSLRWDQRPTDAGLGFRGRCMSVFTSSRRGAQCLGPVPLPDVHVCEELLVLVAPPPPTPMLRTAVPRKQAVHPPHLRPPPYPHVVITVQFFYLQIHAPLPFILHHGIGSLFVWLLGGTSVHLSSVGLMDIFQRMVIFYDLSWNLF